MDMSPGKHAVRLGLVAEVKGINAAEVYFFGLSESEKNLQTYGSLLNGYCHKMMVDKAVALYDTMKEQQLISSLVHNNLMNMYLKLGQHNKVHDIFQEMKAANIRPDGYTYGTLIRSYGSLKDIDALEKLMQEMEVLKITIDWHNCVNLAVAYSSAGLLEKAESALEKVEKLVDRDNQVALCSLLSLYARLGNLAEVNRVWNTLKASFPRPTNMSYYAMLLALSKLDDMGSLKQCFEEWESNYFRYDSRLVCVIIGAYMRKDMMKEAESFCAKAMEKHAVSDIEALEFTVEYFLKRHEMGLALKVFEVVISQVKSQWKPNIKKLSAFLQHFQEVKDVDGAENFLELLRKHDCLDTEDYEYLLSTCASADEKEPLL